MGTKRHSLPILVALSLALSLGWTAAAPAGTPQAQPPRPTAAEKKMEVEGKIKSVDPARGMLTLEDGTQLTIPPTVRVQRESLKEGATVKASYEERNGQKVVTSVEVKAGEKR